MDVATNSVRKRADFAVIRDYAPTRIERELLAQVFDVIQRGATISVAPAGRSQLRIDLSAKSTTQRGVDEQRCDDTNDTQLVVQEPAA